MFPQALGSVLSINISSRTCRSCFLLEAVTCHRALVESDDANHYSSLKTSSDSKVQRWRLAKTLSKMVVHKKRYRSSRTMALYGDQEEKMRSMGGLAPCIMKDVMLVHNVDVVPLCERPHLQ